MSRRWLLSLLCLSVPLLLSVQLSRAGGVLKVNEPATRFSLREDNPRVSLAVENSLDKPFQAVVQLELLDPDGVVQAAATPNVKIAGGNQKLAIDLPGKIRKLKWQKDDLLWYRLRYRIAPEAGSGVEPVYGVISLSEITPELFEIRVASSNLVREGMRYRVTARAQHPLTSRPARGVRIEGTVELENDATAKKTALKASAVSDSEGFAILDFDLPRTIKSDDMKLKIKASRGLLSMEESHDVDLWQKPYIFVTSDKPIYQPGQVLHARVLIFGPAKRALNNAAVTLKISDPDQQVLFQSDLTTSRFGIASADWSIPANARLGSYRIEFSTDNEDNTSWTDVKISRYDLPNFTVSVKPDRSYYLPHENAEVEVAATYLFGQPVKRGQVRVVRETERTWNYREQKYETTEAEKFEGETDSNGVFKTRIDLSEAQTELGKEDYERFQDLRYAAYFTDPTTNRTEQRRFDLRITKEAIHIYIIRAEDHYYDNSRLPLYFYVSTSYADGTPAPCRVTISNDGAPNKPERILRSVKTNRYGLARIEQFEIPRSASDDGELNLNFLASDSQGKTGKHAEGYSFRDEPVIRVATDKTLYRAGEPVAVTVTSSEKNLTAMLEVTSSDWVVQHSEVVRLHDGRATATLPWSKEFVNQLTITVYSPAANEGAVSGCRTILFPQNRELKLGLQANHKTYRPGEDAQLSFRVRDPHGRSAESALGVVVVDKAVAERARTDQEFGSRYHDSSSDILGLMAEGDAVAGIGITELNRIDLSEPVPPEMELAADVMLNQRLWYPLNFFGGEGYEKSESRVFGDLIKAQLKPVRSALEIRYLTNQQYPVDESSLQRILAESGIDYLAVRDPWSTPFHPSFFVEREFDTLTLTSAGADKRFDTSDDFVVERFTWPYFRPMGEAIDRAVSGYHQRTGGFIRDRSTLRDELRKQGVDIAALRDHWAHPYEFGFDISNNSFEIKVSSAGPNGKFDADTPSDDFTLWRSTIDYFAERRAAIDTALAASLKATNHPPQNEAELAAALRPAGIVLTDLRDPWGQRYYSTFNERAFYGDRARIEVRSNYGEAQKESINIKPVTKRVTVINLQSPGPDGREGTPDDFSAGSFSATISEEGAGDAVPQAPSDPTSFSGSTGAIRGILTDPMGAAVAGAQVEATRSSSSTTFETTTDDEGKYLLRNLPPGLYSVHFSASGFKFCVVDQVQVRSSNVAEVDATLSVGNVSETVTVTAEAPNYTTAQSTAVSSTVRQVVVVGASKQQVSTPRLRDYFPETLLWQPSLETDKQGRAQINFKLADNITTWRLAVIGSTEDGQIGTVEKEITAFQPFFVEHDPPRILTEGDEISLPVVVRNYLERPQPVDLELKPESWFTLLGAGQKRAQVAAGDATRETFDFRASASVKDGKQRIIAKGADDSDAIEKPVTVHPDGEEKSATASDLVSDNATLTLDIPAAVIPNSAESELKIYPNLMAHVSESVEAIMRRPYGCGEQTISSTYPSLLLVQNQKQTGQSSALHARAERYLRDGYSRLLNYRADSGGFTYWGRGEPDLALTAYALRFLSDARGLIAVEDDVIAQARSWLVKQQREDGSWAAYDYGNKFENKRRTAMLTAYVARVLAKSAPPQAKGNTNPKQQPTKGASPEVKRALDYLAARVAEIDEPYLMASYVLASLDAEDTTRTAAAAVKLSALGHNEGDSTYWELETNTPFYGWGLAGRIETTALVVQALTRSCASRELNPTFKDNATVATRPSEICNQQLINRGLLFLLRQKDRYGVWYSSQATINVLDALLAVLAHDVKTVDTTNASPTAEIIVNGRSVRSVEMPAAGQLVSPLTIDLSSLLQPGTNHIQIRRASGSSPASVQAVATYYIPWPASNATPESSTRSGGSTGLRLVTKFDQTEGQVSDVISCHVEAERIGFRGYGMLLAEIGLPPGADVDRASLESAMKSSDWAINQYDILPDRVVVYLWPQAGGIKFDFKFRPRFGLKAKTAPSSIYDYYNPEARAVVVPARFVVK